MINKFLPVQNFKITDNIDGTIRINFSINAIVYFNMIKQSILTLERPVWSF